METRRFGVDGIHKEPFFVAARAKEGFLNAMNSKWLPSEKVPQQPSGDCLNWS
jgi:hypothetical protein